MFTVKYRTYEAPVILPSDSEELVGFFEAERIDGPYTSISQRYEEGRLIVSAFRGDADPGMTYGPVIYDDMPVNLHRPRPQLWVMNEAGSTVAKYTL